MSSLREQLIEADLVSHTCIADDGYPVLVMHSRENAADIALRVVATWLDRLAEQSRAGKPEPYGRERTRADAYERASVEIRKALADEMRGGGR